jgi:hypothetical protein
MSGQYILDENGEPVEVDDLMVWAKWLENSGDVRRIARDTIGDVDVSTVFLGLDHNWGMSGPPLLFETMIFGGEHDDWQDRYSTKEDALKGHKRAMKMVKGGK